MAYFLLVESSKAFQELSGYFCSAGSGTWSLQELTQIAVLDILHDNVQKVLVLIPAEEVNKQILTLLIVGVSCSIG